MSKVRVLLEHGANVGAEDEKGRTSLHEAALNPSYEVTLYPLLEAVGVEVVHVLLEHGANIAAEKKGSTPIHEAALNGQVDTAT